MWRVNYLLQSFFALIIHIVEDLHIFYNCVESTLPDFLRHDYYQGYDPDQDPYEIERRQIMQNIKERWEREEIERMAEWDSYNAQQEADIQRWREENPGKDPFSVE